MNLDNTFKYRTFAAIVTSDNGDVAENSITAGLRNVGVGEDEYRILWYEAISLDKTMVIFAISTSYLIELPRLIERGNAESIDEVDVKVVH